MFAKIAKPAENAGFFIEFFSYYMVLFMSKKMHGTALRFNLLRRFYQ